jgi:hypothetical protein
MQLSENIEKAKITNIKKWGVTHPMKLKEIKDKIKRTNFIKYGTEIPMQLEEIKNKIKKTNLERYGVENYTNTDEYKLKSKKTNIERYGIDSYSKTEECKLKVKKTNFKKYGFEYLFQSEKFRELIKTHNLNKYGYEYYSQTDEFLEKVKKSCFKKFGFSNSMKSEAVKEKLKNSFIDKYGVDNPNKLDYIREKIKKTNLKNFGFEYPSQSPDIKEKSKKTNIKNYGVSNIMHNEHFRKQKFIISKHPNYLYFINEDKSNEFKCDCGESHNFKIHADNFYKRLESNLPLCTQCYPIGDSVSIKEEELFKFIKSIYGGEIIQSYRDGLEIDIFLPHLKIGFEFNGLYWHSEKYRDKNYHLNKLNYFNDKGIRIFNIWEDNWIEKNNIIKSQIRNIIGLTENRVFARKCDVREIKDIKMSKSFLNENHIQGFVGSKLKIGLFYKNELVSLMTFDQFEGRKKMKKNDWNLNRFCSKINNNVVGGFSKILKYFIKKYNPNKIISYADKDWSIGNLYEVLDFKKVSQTKPDYKYLINNIRIHKSRYRKSITGISESKLELLKIWDCGKIKYEINFLT